MPESYEEEVRQGYDRWMSRANARAMAGRLGFFLLNTPLWHSWARLGIGRDDRLLDVGCGSGTLLTHLAERVDPHGTWYGVDLSSVQLKLAADRLRACGLDGRVQVRQGSGLALPFGPEEFDVVITSHVLHHVPAAALPEIFREIGRVLRPGGRYLLWAFARAENESRQERDRKLLGRSNAPPDEIMRQLYFHREAEVGALLESAGFRVEPLPLGRFLLPNVRRFSLAAVRRGAPASSRILTHALITGRG